MCVVLEQVPKNVLKQESLRQETEKYNETTEEVLQTAERSPTDGKQEELLSRLQIGGIVSPDEDLIIG